MILDTDKQNCTNCIGNCFRVIKNNTPERRVCSDWIQKPCDHTYSSVSVPGMELIVFECTKCGKEITYKKV